MKEQIAILARYLITEVEGKYLLHYLDAPPDDFYYKDIICEKLWEVYEIMSVAEQVRKKMINWKWLVIAFLGLCVVAMGLWCFVELLLGIDVSGTVWFLIGIPIGLVVFWLFGNKVYE